MKHALLFVSLLTFSANSILQASGKVRHLEPKIKLTRGQKQSVHDSKNKNIPSDLNFGKHSNNKAKNRQNKKETAKRINSYQNRPN